MVCEDLCGPEGCWVAVVICLRDELLSPLPCGGVFIPLLVPLGEYMFVDFLHKFGWFDWGEGQWWKWVGVKGDIIFIGVHD